MNYRLLSALALALCAGFLIAGLVSAQDKKEKKEDGEPKLLSHEEFETLMEDKVKGAFGDARKAAKAKSGKELVTAANQLKGHADSILKYSGPELVSDDPARENKDFENLVEDLKEAAGELAKHAEGSDWDKVTESIGAVGKSCGGCHDQFRPVDDDKYLALMEDDIKTAWSKLKINARKKMGENAAKAADDIAKLAPKILGYSGPVLRGKKKGKLARHQDDFQDWVEELKEASENYAKYARKGDWEKAEEYKDAINETCGDCHDEYEPFD